MKMKEGWNITMQLSKEFLELGNVQRGKQKHYVFFIEQDRLKILNPYIKY
jgi:hypothetical protein